MKPLNRPMFRYGGPIKEGVMSGIKEPRQNYNMAGRVIGSVKNFFKKPTAPANSGIVATNAATKGGFIPSMGTKIKELFRGRDIPTSVAAGGNTATKGGQVIVPYGARVSTGSVRGNIPFGKNPFDNQSILAATQRVLTPATDAVIGTAKAVKPYTGALTIAGVTYSMLKPDGTPKTIEELKVETGADTTTITEEIKSNEPKVLTAEEKRKAQIDKYRDIVDIKGMNKDAAYNSLIAASQAINESGDFKGDIKSGKLINQIIQSTSKAFDKPKQTKDAIDTLILKGEIEKDIKASDPAAKQKARLTEKQIAIADKSLAGDSFSDIITERYKKGKVPRGDELAGILRATEKVDVTTIDSTKIPSGVDPQTFFESQIQESIKAGTPVNPGYYVISDRVLIVDEQGNVTPLL